MQQSTQEYLWMSPKDVADMISGPQGRFECSVHLENKKTENIMLLATWKQTCGLSFYLQVSLSEPQWPRADVPQILDILLK